MKGLLPVILFLIAIPTISSQADGMIIHFNAQPPKDLLPGLKPLSEALNIYQYLPNETDQGFKKIQNLESVEYYYPNHPVQWRSVRPDDSRYHEQWNMEIIDMPRVWQETTGGVNTNGERIVVAMLDDGIDSGHNDLIENVWVNEDEIPGDGIDNDMNGYIDDHEGVNIQDGNDLHPRLDHGTKVAGIIGARGNNQVGVAGVNWDAEILILSGVTNVAEIITAYDYIYRMKKKYLESDGEEGANIMVTNFSAGISRVFPTDFPGWCAMYDLLGEVGVLSVGSTANENFNPDIEGDLPTLCNSDYLIMVTNTNRSDIRVTEAATSKLHVDIGAPGNNIFSLDLGDNYGTISGTSASAPHVAGAIAILYAIPCQRLTNLAVSAPSEAALLMKTALLNGADSISGLDNTVSGGRLNVYQAMLELSAVCGESELGTLEVTQINTQQAGTHTFNLEIYYKTDVFSDHTCEVVDITGRLLYKSTFNPNLFEEKVLYISGLTLPSSAYAVIIRNSTGMTSKLFSFAR